MLPGLYPPPKVAAGLRLQSHERTISEREGGTGRWGGAGSAARSLSHTSRCNSTALAEP